MIAAIAFLKVCHPMKKSVVHVQYSRSCAYNPALAKFLKRIMARTMVK